MVSYTYIIQRELPDLFEIGVLQNKYETSCLH
jgi:hypothetical protein